MEISNIFKFCYSDFYNILKPSWTAACTYTELKIQHLAKRHDPTQAFQQQQKNPSSNLH